MAPCLCHMTSWVATNDDIDTFKTGTLTPSIIWRNFPPDSARGVATFSLIQEAHSNDFKSVVAKAQKKKGRAQPMSAIHNFLVLSSLKLTTKKHLKMYGWKMIHFLLGWLLGRCYISLRKCVCFFSRITLEASKMMLWKGVSFQQWQFWV